MRRWRPVILLAAVAAGAVAGWLWLGAPARRQARAEAMLRVVLPEVSFPNVNLGEAVETLRVASGADIALDPRLRDENIVNQSVEMRLRNVTLAQALSALTGYVNSAGWNIELVSDVRDGVVVLTHGDSNFRHAYLRVYDITDLRTVLEETAAEAAASTQGYAGGLFGGGFSAVPAVTPPTLDEEAVRLVQESVFPETWLDNGGSGSVVLTSPGHLLVVADGTVHARIDDLLAQLRETATTRE